MSEAKSFDVIIAGGAMAGATLALALDSLSQGGLNIAVIEAYQTNHHAHPGFDARSIALSFGTVGVLQQLKLWSAIQPVATPITHIHVSDRFNAGMTDITRESAALMRWVTSLNWLMSAVFTRKKWRSALRFINFVRPVYRR